LAGSITGQIPFLISISRGTSHQQLLLNGL
jgi:hypothetical protein